MCPQAPRSSLEYSHKEGLQTVITEKPLQIGLVIHSAARGLLQWVEFHMGLRVGRGREIGRPRRRPSSCSVLDEGWKLSVALPPLVRRDWRRQRAKGSVFAFAPTLGQTDLPRGRLLRLGRVSRRGMLTSRAAMDRDPSPHTYKPLPLLRRYAMPKQVAPVSCARAERTMGGRRVRRRENDGSGHRRWYPPSLVPSPLCSSTIMAPQSIAPRSGHRSVVIPVSPSSFTSARNHACPWRGRSAVHHNVHEDSLIGPFISSKETHARITLPSDARSIDHPSVGCSGLPGRRGPGLRPWRCRGWGSRSARTEVGDCRWSFIRKWALEIRSIGIHLALRSDPSIFLDLGCRSYIGRIKARTVRYVTGWVLSFGFRSDGSR
jgi:hypothetical protein